MTNRLRLHGALPPAQAGLLASSEQQPKSGRWSAKSMDFLCFWEAKDADPMRMWRMTMAPNDEYPFLMPENVVVWRRWRWEGRCYVLAGRCQSFYSLCQLFSAPKKLSGPRFLTSRRWLCGIFSVYSIGARSSEVLLSTNSKKMKN